MHNQPEIHAFTNDLLRESTAQNTLHWGDLTSVSHVLVHTVLKSCEELVGVLVLLDIN